jgi:pyrroloquinoline quinone (PQQ) biosynthesis protein C
MLHMQTAPHSASHSTQHRDDQVAASTYVEALIDEALSHRAVNHPYLYALSSGALPDNHWALTDFARAYYGYSAHFPRYLTAAISRLDTAAHRTALVENLTEESGHYHEEELAQLESSGIHREWIVGVPHPELFRRFREALGLQTDDGLNDTEVICWRELFYGTIAHGSAAEAIGALGLGTETIVSTIYRHFVKALNRIALPPESSVFFPLHCDVDDAHQETLKRIAIDLAHSEEGRRGLRLGMRKALLLRAGFWDYLLERAKNEDMRKAA